MTLELSSHDGGPERLSLAYQSLPAIPRLEHPTALQSLDVSHNFLGSLKGLDGCEALRTLVADCNQVIACDDLPTLPALRGLSLNHNRVAQLLPLMEVLRARCPNLRWLSLMGNPACPHPISGTSDMEYSEYRLCVLAYLKAVTVIDCRRVTPEERLKSHERLGTWAAGRPTELHMRLDLRGLQPPLSPATSRSSGEATPGPDCCSPTGLAPGPERTWIAGAVQRVLSFDVLSDTWFTPRLSARSEATPRKVSAVTELASALATEKAARTAAELQLVELKASVDRAEAATQAAHETAVSHWAAHCADLEERLAAESEALRRMTDARDRLQRAVEELRGRCGEHEKGRAADSAVISQLRERIAQLDARNARLAQDVHRTRGHVMVLQSAMAPPPESPRDRQRRFSPALAPAETAGLVALQADEILRRTRLISEQARDWALLTDLD